MTSIKGLNNSPEDIKKKNDKKIFELKRERSKSLAGKQSSIFIKKFKKGARVQTVQEMGPSIHPGFTKPKIENVYDKDGNFLYERTTDENGKVRYHYKDNGMNVDFYDDDNDGNMDRLEIRDNRGNGLYSARSTNDNGKFDKFNGEK